MLSQHFAGENCLINLLLVDDHEIVRTGIRRILEDSPKVKVVGEASSGEGALQWCRKNSAHIVLMDMHMPGIGGIEATRRLLKQSPTTRIIMLTICTENPLPMKMMQAGASGYLSKSVPTAEMVNAINLVYSGQRYISPEIAQQMALSQISPDGSASVALLSERELQIMMMITEGQKVSDISEQLNLSSKTVNSYRYRIFHKLAVNGDVELTHFAIRYGILRKNKV